MNVFGPDRNADPVDTWLRLELSRLHGEVLAEPVPAELLALLDRVDC